MTEETSKNKEVEGLESVYVRGRVCRNNTNHWSQNRIGTNFNFKRGSLPFPQGL